jgi:hypothetical protein
MPIIEHYEPKHLSGKDGIGKGSMRRHGEDTDRFRDNFDRIDWSNHPKANGRATSEDH